MQRTDIPEEIVRAARAAYGKDAHLVRLRCPRREALVCDGQVVGFVTPHREKVGWRHGPMFIRPEYRGRGLLEAYYRAHPERECVAFVEDGNVASLKAHTRAGFTFWRRHAHGVFLRRPPVVEEHEDVQRAA